MAMSCRRSWQWRRSVNAWGFRSVKTRKGGKRARVRTEMTKTVAGVILAVSILIIAGGFDQAWAAPGLMTVRAGAPGPPPPAWGGPRPGWWGAPRVWWGGGFGWGWGPRPWWGPAWYGVPAVPFAYPYAPPAVVAQPSPQTYVQQIPPATGESQTQSHWYYCAESRSYYPYVGECPEGWMVVVPSSPSQ